jgi:para-nitrobenzyl esterase
MRLPLDRGNASCIASVAQGRLRGAVVNGIRRFLSVPFAAPPVGANQFELPQPPGSWGGLRDATQAGATAPHSIPRAPTIDVTPSFAPGWVEGPDYLTLNVWRPNDDRDDLPVFVYIHGGGFINGSKDMHIIDGEAFARDGLVCIAINYRLGLEGFLPVAGAPSNLGLRDQIAALRWIQSNVRNFGGDPHNLTLGGESAGAISVGCLLSSPLAEGLFSRAILQRGSGMAREHRTASRATERLARLLRVSPDVAGFRAVSPRLIVKAQDRLVAALIDLRDSNGIDPAFGVSKFLPVYGDDVIPDRPAKAIAGGAGAGLPLLISTCRDEINALSVPLRFERWMIAPFARFVLGKFHPQAKEILQAYGLGRRGYNSGRVLSSALTDLAIRWPARRLAEQHHGSAHLMEFDWRSPAMGGRYGAAHGTVVPFIFDTLHASTGPDPILGPSPPQTLAHRCHRIWVQFIKGAGLDWPAFGRTSRAVYSLVRGAAASEPLPAVADVLDV